MPKRPPGYFVQGHFVAYGSELDVELQAQRRPDGQPTRTELKAASTELQKLGEDLAALSAERQAALHLPTPLADALAELKRTASHEGIRRQRQYIGKQMRRLTDDEVQTIRRAVAAHKAPGLQEKTRQAELENWREQLVAHDDTITQFVQRHPTCDVQQLRALVRQARRERTPAQAEPLAGQGVRQSRAWRELFKWLRDATEPAAADGKDPRDLPPPPTF
jgi:ribosome-associated protein